MKRVDERKVKVMADRTTQPLGPSASGKGTLRNAPRRRLSPVKAIRLKCLDCSYGSPKEVALCPLTFCPVYPFRMGTNPNRRRRPLSEDERRACAERLRIARAVRGTQSREQTRPGGEGGGSTGEQARMAHRDGGTHE